MVIIGNQGVPISVAISITLITSRVYDIEPMVYTWIVASGRTCSKGIIRYGEQGSSRDGHQDSIWW